MAFYVYKEDLDKYILLESLQYNTTCDYDFPSTPIQTSSQYSSPYEFVQPKMFDYKSSVSVPPSKLDYSVYAYEYQSSYNYNYDEYSVNPSQVNFYTEPAKLLQYESSSYARVYAPSETKLTISYSTAEFNEPEFEEYDQTPYSGGYDPVTTYGKPLPPSDITCYPRSVPQSDSISLEIFSYASIPSPYGKDDDDDLPIMPPNEGSKPVDTKDDINGDKVTSADFVDGDEIGGYDYENESERQVTQSIPLGSGLEALDLCESLFGYWPCLAKRAHEQRSKCDEFCDQERRMDPWKSAADYLFGSPLVYDYENCHNHHQEQSQYGNSWLQ